ncbi:MAG: 2-oxoacid:ferredoxin oxidoreductase subunit beta [Firmicutes bacterium]|nr:2-oxoacid:ferredoxin oxidoreductase subunit beta [Bacillota bacterium]
MPELARKYLRNEKMPFVWCPGCGHGIVVRAILGAVDKAGLAKEKTVVVAGIGCSGRAAGYLDFCTVHALHGRAIPFATGIKLANPELSVIVISGDGDLAAIGGNHFIHAARRNIDLTVICFNNNIYGMTGGQYSPTTPRGSLASTAPYGLSERSFDLCRLAEAAGATYVARGSAYQSRMLANYMLSALENQGFSFVEAISQCPVYFGRKNKLGGPLDMLEWQKEHSIPVRKAESVPEEELAEKFTVGEFYKKPAPEYGAEYRKLLELRRKEE